MEVFKEDEAIISKSDVLAFLRTRLKTAKVEEINIVIAKEFINCCDDVVHNIKNQFNGRKIVVRSSSKNEDSMVTSNAGHFDSVLNVDSGNYEEVKNAIIHVLESYKDDGLEYDGFLDEQVLVQSMTGDIIMSGVVFTRDLLHNRPYYMVNYDDDGSTDSVTSGKAGKVVYIAHDAPCDESLGEFFGLIRAVKEIQALCSIDNLDIEFGINKMGEVFIFQTRPLAAVSDIKKMATDEEVFAARKIAREYLEETAHTFSDMAFWNPSEIIGDNPFPLDYSLYREIITSYAWSSGISALGYNYINDDLMYQIGNKPYISTDYSFMGLTPAYLSPQLQKKLKRYYDKKLREDPTSHDKIEFEIVYSVFDFCTEMNMDELLDYGFSKNEISEIHKNLFLLTCMAVESYPETYKDDMEAVARMMEYRHEVRRNSPMSENDIQVIKEYIGRLLTSIREDGTPQFARQARLAFMARSFCKTLVQTGYFEASEMDAFMLSINTVASDFERDFDAFRRGRMTREEFNYKFGHLRLGTYNIRTDCYAKMYFDADKSDLQGSEKQRIEPKTLDYGNVKKALQDYEISIEPEEFVTFLKNTTENREYFKFEFTKSLSLVIELIIRLGEIYNIDRNDLSFLGIMDIFNSDSREELLEIINENKKKHEINSGLILPEVIFSPSDIDIIRVSAARPNFITAKTAKGELVFLDAPEFDREQIDITGKVVCVTKADPGYDWIFTKNIAGFITKYGGAASHMSIRCAEFDIPAAIGCGEKVFSEVRSMKSVFLDCEKGKITKLS